MRCSCSMDAGDGCRITMPDGVPALVRSTDSFPQYAYGLLLAAVQAHRLGLRTMTAVELGVAGGNGMVELERLAPQVSSHTGVEIDIVGFDLGVGMPAPTDHRDLPYIWQQGFFTMDEPLLRSRLTTSHLILGDIAHTLLAFLGERPPVVGFVSFDLDFYSSTAAALQAIRSSDGTCFLPRTICYFDDTVGPHEELHSRFAGELLAIEEFNSAEPYRKLAPINGLQHKLHPLGELWIAGMYVLHDFAHPGYNAYIYHEPSRQFPLEPAPE